MHLLAWLVIAVLYAPTLAQLYTSGWRMVDYTHAYFILPVSLWLVWQDRYCWGPLLEERRKAAGPLPLAILACGLVVFLFGWRFDYLSIATASLIPVLYGAAAALYGPQLAKAFDFPIGYLALLIPPPAGVLDAITLPMRYGASVVGTWVLKLLGYPVARQGLLLAMGTHEIYLGAPCSGFRSLITMLTLGLLYVHLAKSERRHRLLLISAIVPLALIGNLIRVLALCLVTYYFGEAAGQGFFHTFSGLLVFAIMLLGLMNLERLLCNSPTRCGV